MKKRFYLLLINKDSDTDYGVEVSDLPGCFSAGNTLEEAIQNAKEAIELHNSTSGDLEIHPFMNWSNWLSSLLKKDKNTILRVIYT